MLHHHISPSAIQAPIPVITTHIQKELWEHSIAFKFCMPISQFSNLTLFCPLLTLNQD